MDILRAIILQGAGRENIEVVLEIPKSPCKPEHAEHIISAKCARNLKGPEVRRGHCESKKGEPDK
jgi:hypothetical protein